MPNVSYLAIIVAAFASFVFGAVWYVLLGVRWQAALGKSEAELQAAASPVPFVATGVMAWMLAGILGHLGMVDVWHGMGNRFAEFSPNSQIRLASNYLKLSDFEQGWSDEHV